jgi:hypothetical protein
MSDRQGILDRLLRRSPGVPLAAGHLPPKKVAWLNPLQLLRTGYHVWLVTAGTGIIDRREMLAALDRSTVPTDPSPESVLIPGTHVDAVLADPARYEHDGLWLDFVADTGDSWEATYAVASLLVDRHLWRRFPPSARKDFPGKFGPADVVALGGDLVYPMASRDAYRRRFRAPFTAALPKTTGHPIPGMFAIPGNHDWYDGLTSFCREFCQGGFLGGWQLFQRRSYFAVKLTKGWWLWGIDIALDTRIDAPQQEYFLNILQGSERGGSPADEFEPGDRVILCTAKPAWLEISRYSDEAYRNLVYFVEDVVEKNGGDVPVILAGDLHHYSRYRSESDRQMIVAGGGGAYLMGTHFLPGRIPKLARRPSLDADSRPSAAVPSPVQQTAGDAFIASGFPYPSREVSRKLALGSLFLAFRPANWRFCLLIGVVYWFLTRGVRQWRLPPTEQLPGGKFTDFLSLPKWIWFHPEATNLILVIAVIALCAVFAVVVNNRASRFLTMIWGALHGAIHVWLAVGVALLFGPRTTLVDNIGAAIHLPNVGSYVVPTLFAVIAGLIGGTTGGIYLAVSDRFLDLHHNDAFAVQSLIDYRSFLRMRIRPDGLLEIFPIGLRRVPRRWRRRMDGGATDPLYEPADDELLPHLIEGPIRIRPHPVTDRTPGFSTVVVRPSVRADDADGDLP